MAIPHIACAETKRVAMTGTSKYIAMLFISYNILYSSKTNESRLRKTTMKENVENISLGVIVVAFNNEDSIDKLLDSLNRQLSKSDRIILVDNHPNHKCAAIAEKKPYMYKVLRSSNIGFGGACNLAASHAEDTDMLFFINPDSLPEKNAINELKKAYIAKPKWAAWMSLLGLEDNTVNSCGCSVHISGLSWAKGLGSQISKYTEPHAVDYLSGACLAIRTKIWKEIGGFTSEYFMYYEDTEISTKLLLRGYKKGIWPKSLIIHDYDFNNGKMKWFYLERNRIVYIATCWPLPVLISMLPLLVVTEAALWPVALIQRRLITKIHSTVSLFTMIPFILRKRSELMKSRKISSKELIKTLETNLDNPYLGNIGKIKPIIWIFSTYKSILIRIMP